jgi:predicted dehydrogenase
MNQLNVAVIGTGWCGGIRAVACAQHPICADLHIAESNPERLAEMVAQTTPASATDDWEALIGRSDIDVVLISATPETLHYPMAKAALEAGKHVLLEKPMALRLEEADELIDIAESNNLKFTIGYSQRFNAKQALAKRSLVSGDLGEPSSILVSRHIGRNLGAKIGNRIKLSPAAMEATPDIDFAMWCLEPRRPVRVYSQNSYGVRREMGLPDSQLTVITMDDGVVVTINAGMSLPNHYQNAATT